MLESIVSSVTPVALQMSLILVSLWAMCASVYAMQDRKPKAILIASWPFSWLPVTLPNPSKRHLQPIYIYEKFCLQYSVVWMGVFGVIVATGAYDHFTSP